MKQLRRRDAGFDCDAVVPAHERRNREGASFPVQRMTHPPALWQDPIRTTQFSAERGNWTNGEGCSASSVVDVGVSRRRRAVAGAGARAARTGRGGADVRAAGLRGAGGRGRRVVRADGLPGARVGGLEAGTGGGGCRVGRPALRRDREGGAGLRRGGGDRPDARGRAVGGRAPRHPIRARRLPLGRDAVAAPPAGAAAGWAVPAGRDRPPGAVEDRCRAGRRVVPRAAQQAPGRARSAAGW
jgi:hypothetical protein